MWGKNITFVVKRGPLTLMLKVSSIMSGVTVSSVTFLLMPALFISRFRPPAPTLDSTNFLASSIVFISLTSVNKTRKKIIFRKNRFKNVNVYICSKIIKVWISIF